MILNNPYLYHPHPLCKAAVGVLCSIIEQNTEWKNELAKGKMLGVMIVEHKDIARVHYLKNKYL